MKSESIYNLGFIIEKAKNLANYPFALAILSLGTTVQNINILKPKVQQFWNDENQKK